MGFCGDKKKKNTPQFNLLILIPVKKYWQFLFLTEKNIYNE